MGLELNAVSFPLVMGALAWQCAAYQPRGRAPISPMHRREFLRYSGLGVATWATGTGTSWVAPMQVGCAAITWGGNDPAAITDIAAAGYPGIQLRASAVQRWRETPDALKALLAQHHLAFPVLSSGSVPFEAARLAESAALHTQHARFARAAGCRYVQVTDERPRNQTPQADDYLRMGRALSDIGARMADEGVTLVYHNHMDALGERPDEVARILDAANADHVKLLLDVAHWQAAGGDPVAAVSQYASRIAVVHLKDLEQPAPGGSATSYRFRELGAGRVDLPSVLAALNATGFAGWGIVELDGVPDPAQSPRYYAESSRRYLEAHNVRVTR
jgi:inosose dehydratase